jgi:hypothetical protein
MSVIEQITWVAKDATHHMYDLILMQLIANQLQLNHDNFSTTIQLPYDYNHNVMISFFIHS